MTLPVCRALQRDEIRRAVQNPVLYGLPMAAGALAATPIVVDAWVVLVATASIVASFVGIGLTITFHLGGRIDHVSGELVLVRERVARLEALFSGRGESPDPSGEAPPAGA